MIGAFEKGFRDISKETVEQLLASGVVSHRYKQTKMLEETHQEAYLKFTSHYGTLCNNCVACCDHLGKKFIYDEHSKLRINIWARQQWM
jgi:hypothetical protein